MITFTMFGLIMYYFFYFLVIIMRFHPPWAQKTSTISHVTVTVSNYQKKIKVLLNWEQKKQIEVVLRK